MVDTNFDEDDDFSADHEPKRRRKRAAVSVGFKDFLKRLTTLSGVGKDVGEAASLMKNVKSGVKSFDEIVTSLPVTKNRAGALLIGDEFVGRVRRIMREGDLEALVKIGKRPSVVVSGAEKSSFRALVADTPEKALKDLSDLSAKTKQLHPALDTTVENIDKLAASSKAELKTVESNLTKRFKQGTVIALTIGTIYVGVDWLSKATQARKGCFMLSTINNKVSSCKVAAFSCASSVDTTNACSSVPAAYNTTLVLMAIAELDDSDQRKIDVATAAGAVVSSLKQDLAIVIDKSYEKVSAVVAAMHSKPTVNVCSIVHPAIENGKVPPCRMCSPSDNPTSTTFIDPSQYAENITFRCVVNPSVLDTITDAVVNTGANLWQGVNSTIFGSIKRFGIIFAILLILVLVIWFASRLFGKK